MPLYYYNALSCEGRKKKGVIDADSIEGAKRRLRAQEMIITKIGEKRGGRGFTLTRDDLLHFTQEVYQLLHAGLPLYETLLTIQEKIKQSGQKTLFLELSDAVKQGKNLSVAMAKYPNSFDMMYISMVAAGENSGDLEATFRGLYAVIARSEKYKKQVRAALTYPAFLGVFCLAILAGLFFFLVPSMQELLEGRPLHPMTHMVIATSQFLRTYGMVLLVGVVAVGVTVGVLLHKYKGLCKEMLMHLPLCKRMMTESVMMRFCRSLSLLLAGGIPIVEAMRLARCVMNHPTFERVMVRAEEGLIRGLRISDELRASPVIPGLVVRMWATAEEVGNNAEMLGNIADMYEEKLEKSLTQFTNLLQPVMLLVLGVVVGVILLSVLLPLVDVSSLS